MTGSAEPLGPPTTPRSGTQKGGDPGVRPVWPFAITRSVDTGFHIVVAPDFLVACDLHHLLSDVVAGEAAEGIAYLRQYRDRGTRRLWVLYRVGHLRGADVGLNTEYALHGTRRTPLVEGVVCDEEGRPPQPTDDFFDWIHGACAESVRAFFTADSGTHPVCASEGAKPPDTGTALRVVEETPYRSERNLQVALAGHHPSPPRFASPAARPVRSSSREGVAAAGPGTARGERVDVDRGGHAGCVRRVRLARRLALAAGVVALGLGATLIVVLLR
ncbi:hypothetical protein AB0F96_01435 [Streptomyces sp. NPDC023998]|uniref:hypothetical protein n=1 Tax=Streptomyces sp. NPDC023998 TaxID=3154597 RepID=UPI0033EB9E99